jgi:RNase P subunit RPR2
MLALPFPVRLGSRQLVALTCAMCHQLHPGDQYERRPRTVGGLPYLDRRCRRCRWARMEANPGR